MYVHIGGDKSVIDSSIALIINLDTVKSTRDINSFISAEDESNRLEYLSEELPKSLILTSDRTYVSSVSSDVIRKRSENIEVYE